MCASIVSRCWIYFGFIFLFLWPATQATVPLCRSANSWWPGSRIATWRSRLYLIWLSLDLISSGWFQRDCNGLICYGLVWSCWCQFDLVVTGLRFGSGGYWFYLVIVFLVWSVWYWHDMVVSSGLYWFHLILTSQIPLWPVWSDCYQFVMDVTCLIWSVLV